MSRSRVQELDVVCSFTLLFSLCVLVHRRSILCFSCTSSSLVDLVLANKSGSGRKWLRVATTEHEAALHALQRIFRRDFGLVVVGAKCRPESLALSRSNDISRSLDHLCRCSGDDAQC